MTSTTANGKYNFSKMYNDKPLSFYVNETHKALSEKSGWKYSPLKCGSFGFDNMANSVGKVLESLEKNEVAKTDISKLADLVHQGWVENYIFWRDNSPFEKNNLYFKPYSPLGDDRRNKCAETDFVNLPEHEKNKDVIIAECLCSLF